MADNCYDSLEAAALAEWDAYRNVVVRVVGVDLLDEENAVVFTDTDPSHPMKNYVRRTEGGWVFVADSN